MSRKPAAEKAPRDTTPPLVPAVVHAVAILRHLNRARTGLGVTAIARDVGISPSSCFNLLKTLVAEGLLTFSSESKHYAPGDGLAELAGVAVGRRDIARAATPAMQALADRYGLTGGLWRVTATGRLVLVAMWENDSTTRIHIAIGQRQPVHAGAAGRAYTAAAGEPRRVVARAFAAIRWQGDIDFDTYWQQIETTRARGWAIDENLFLRGVTSIAVAVVDPDGVPRYCLTGSMFSGQHSPEVFDDIGSAIRAAAGAI